MSSDPRAVPFALVTKEEDSDWNVVFPDLPGCVTAGRLLDEAVAFAEEALALHVHGLREDGGAPPAQSNIEDVMANPESAGALFCLVPLKPLAGFAAATGRPPASSSASAKRGATWTSGPSVAGSGSTVARCGAGSMPAGAPSAVGPGASWTRD